MAARKSSVPQPKKQGLTAFGLMAFLPLGLLASWHCTLQAQLQNTYLGDISLIASYSLKAIGNSL